MHAGLEWNWGPAQLVPSLGLLGEDQAAYLQLGLRASLRLATSISVDVEAVSWLPASVPDEPGRCAGGTRAGLGVRGLLAHGILGFAQYSAGTGCEPTHSLTLGATFAFGEYPLRKIPTAEEAGVQRLWLGMVDPVLDCNGWMLDDQSHLPLFKYGERVPGTNLVRRGDEVFPIGEHFDIDRRGRLYRPHQYVALAGEHEFTHAPLRDKLALPVCEAGPKHRFFEHCKSLHKSIAFISDLVRSDGNAGWPAVLSQQMEFERECLSQEEQDDPKRLIERLAAALGSRGLRPAMGLSTAPPPTPPAGSPGGSPSIQPAAIARRLLDERRVRHIFRNKAGHLLADTPANRQRIVDVANRDENFLGPDGRGNVWYGEVHPDGTQTWVQVRGDRIINAGVNTTPRTWNPLTGLSAPEPPKR